MTASGGFNIEGGTVALNANLTSTGTGDINIIGDNNSNTAITATGTINKTGGGDSTLAVRSNGRINLGGAITDTSASGKLNVVLWSDYGNNNLYGVSGVPTMTTKGGYVWIGGSNTANGSTTWNGLTVGDGPSVGSSSGNNNAIDMTGAINTTNGASGGDVYIWGGAAVGVSLAGGATPSINAGSGNVTLRGNTFGWTSPYNITNTGAFTLWSGSGTMTADTGSFGQATDLNYFKFNAIPSSFTWGGTGNSLGVVLSPTYNSTLPVAGPISIYGSRIVPNGMSLTSTAAGAAILLQAQGNIDTFYGGAASRFTLTTNNGAVSVIADSDANGSGLLTLNGLTINPGSGNVIVRGETSLWDSSAGLIPTINGTGQFTFESSDVSFGQAMNPNWFSLNSTLTGLNWGKSTNTQDVTVAGATSINGFITIYGSNISVNANLTSTGAGTDILLKASGGIVNNGYAITSYGGDITLWSNSTSTTGAPTTGGVYLKDSSTLDSRTDADRTASNISTATGGGTITLGGGSASTTLASGTAVPTGYAQNISGTSRGVGFGTDTLTGHDAAIHLYSGGGDITLRGQDTVTGNTAFRMGVGLYRGVTIDAGGTGNLTIEGIGSGGVNVRGMEFNAWGGGAAADLFKTGNGNITINGNASGGSGDNLAVIISGTVEATGSGGITITGTSSGTSPYDIDISANVLAHSGPINITGQSTGTFWIAGAIGRLSGSDVTSSSSNVTLTSNVITVGAATTVDTTGTLTVQPYDNDFSSALSWPLTNLSLGSSITGLTIGKSATSADGILDVAVTIGSATSIAGPINIYGGNITINTGATLTSTAGTQGILLKGSGSISQFANVQTNGGSVIEWADSNADSDGMIYVKSASITTSGGQLWMGGGSQAGSAWNGLTVGSGYAAGNTTASNGITLDAATLNTSGGNMALYGKGRAGGSSFGGSYTASSNTNGIRLMNSNTLNSGSGTIYMSGVAQGANSSNGIEFSQTGSADVVTSANTTANAITLIGDASAAQAGAADAWGVYTWQSSIRATNGGGINITGNSNKNSGVGIGSGSSVQANAGTITLTGTGYGGTTPYAVNIAGTVGKGSAITSSTSDIVIVGNTFSATGATIASSGNLTLQPYTSATTIGLAGGTGTLSLAASLFSGGSRVFSDGFTSITIGNANAGNVTVGGVLTLTDSANVVTGGNLTINAASSISDSQAAGTLALAATGNFINNGGASAVQTTDAGTSDRWIVYSARPSLDTFGSLSSASKAIWGQTYSSLAPASVGSGNRYVFANAADAAITATTTNIASKVYGQTADLSSNISYTGLAITSAATYGNVYLNNAASDVLGTLPTASSAGAVNTADVTVTPYTISASGGVANSGYSLAYVNSGTLTVTPKALTMGGLTVASSKVYDGTTTAVVGGTAALTGTEAFGAGTSSDGLAYTGDAVSITGSAAGAYNSPNVASASSVTFSGLSLTGAKAGNYTLTVQSPASATITPAPLTITANNDADFVTQADSRQGSNYRGVVYSGLVNGETSAVLGGTLAVTRSNPGVTAAGNYTLAPAGQTSSNYAISYVNGTYSIVAADRLLVEVGNQTATYGGTTPVYVISSAKYLASDNTTINDLTSSVTANGSNSFIVDGVTFSISPTGVVTSSALKTAVGGYQLDGSVTSGTFNNFHSLAVTGSLSVTQKSISANASGGITKVYDGTTAMTGVSIGLTGLETNDQVTVSGSGAFNSKNVGNGIVGYTIAGLTLGGLDASNYYLTGGSSFSGTDGTISPKTVSLSAVKTYDGTTTLGAGTVTVTTGVGGETLSYSGATASNKNVTFTGKYINALTLVDATDGSGGLASNYQLPSLSVASASNSVSITAASLTLTPTTDSKTYDGNVSSTATVNVSDKATSDTVTVAEQFASKNVLGSNVSTLQIVSGYTIVDGSAADMSSNYTITDSATATGTITPKTVGLSASKTYDGSTSLTGDVTVATGVGSETLTYTGATASNKNVTAPGKYINALTLANATDGSGGLAANYQLPTLNAANAAVTITTASLTLTPTTDSKTYDGNVSSTATVNVSGKATSDTVTVAEQFASKNVLGSNVSTLQIVSGYTLVDGSNADMSSNYTITDSATATGTITPKTVGLSASKTYDGSTSLTGDVTVTTGVGSETLTYTGATANDAHVLTVGKYINAIALADASDSSGGLASNYQLPTLNASNAAVSIGTKTLTTSASISGTLTKVYDGSTSVASSTASIGGSVSGAVVGDTLSLDTTGVTLAYDNAHVASASQIGVTSGSVGYSINSNVGSLSSDYSFSAPSVAPVAAHITRATLTATVTNSGVTKVYDGSTDAPTGFTPTYSYLGLVSGDTGAALSNTGAQYDNQNVATASKVTVSGLAITGISGSHSSAVGDYVLDATAKDVAASISKKTISLSATKVYDGSTDLTGDVTVATGVGSETLTYTGATANDAHVATSGKYINALTLGDASDSSGGLASNYQLPTLNASNATLTISTKALTASATISGTLTKVYDGTTNVASSTASIGGSVNGAVTGDTLSLDTTGVPLAYDNAHVANASQIGVASGTVGYSISSTVGSLSSDYSFSAPTVASVAAHIARATLTATVTNSGVTKVYDGSTDAPAGFTPTYSYLGLVSGDTAAALTNTGAAYNSQNALNANKVTVSGLAIASISGSHSSAVSDYVLDAASKDVAASITPKSVTISGLAVSNKTYDGSTSASVTSWGDVSPGVGSETLTLTGSSANFTDPNAANAKLVTATGYTLANGSGLASNYQLSSTSATTTADIRKAQLTVSANNDAKFVTQSDASGYNGVSYSGFVNGEDSSVLSGTAAISRSNSSTNSAGSYSGVLVPATNGLSATNYSFQSQNGNYTIVGSNQMLVKVNNTSTTYGSTPVPRNRAMGARWCCGVM